MTTVKLTAAIETEGAGKAASDLEKFAKSADKADKEVAGLSKQMKELSSKHLGSVGSGLSSLASSFNKTAGVAIVGFTGALTAAIVATASAEDAINDLSQQSGISVDRFKELSFAFKTVGISQEGLADTSRKITNELGQFAQSGAGGFKAVFDAIKGKVDLTADSLKNLSGADVLQKVKNALDEANIPLQQQGFLLDGLAKGTSKLIPLLNDQGAAMNAAAEKYNKFNSEIKLTSSASTALGDVADEFDLLKTTMGNASAFMISSFAPQIKAVIDWMLENIPMATRTMTTFFQSFLDTKDKTDLDALQVELVKTEENVHRLGKSIDEFQKTGSTKSEKAVRKLVDADANEFEISRMVEDYKKGLIKIEEIKKQMNSVSERNALTTPIETPQATTSFEDNAALQKTLDDAMKKELDWYQNRLTEFQSFIAETDKLGKTQLELINQDEQSRLKILESFRNDDVDGLNQSEAAKTAIILEAEQQRKALIDQARKPADDFLAALSMQGLSELDLIEQQERLKLDKLREFANQGLVEYSDFEDAKTAIFEQAQKERDALQLAQNQLALSAGEQFFGALADLQKTFGDEQGAAYKTLFALSKGFALAQAALNLSSAIASASVTGITPAEKFANMAAVAAAVGQVVSSISSITYNPREQGGQFAAGQQLLVGERGAELVQFGSGGRIANANQTAGMMNGSANVTIINQTSGKIDKTEVTRDSKGDMIIVAKEILVREASNPNSEFNKTLDRTRQAPRKVS